MLSLRSLYTELNEFSYNKVYSLVRTSLQAICDCPILQLIQVYDMLYYARRNKGGKIYYTIFECYEVTPSYATNFFEVHPFFKVILLLLCFQLPTHSFTTQTCLEILIFPHVYHILSTMHKTSLFF